MLKVLEFIRDALFVALMIAFIGLLAALQFAMWDSFFDLF
jgi:hypothetical protein